MTMEENEPLSSDDETNVKSITLEQVIEECGSLGRYQYIHFFFLTFFPIATGIFNFYYVFGVAEIPYKCYIPDEMPVNIRIEVLPSQCSYELKDDFNKTIGIFPCTEWIYDQSVFGQTFTEETNLVCQYGVYRSFVATMLQMGAMLIFFSGQMTDIFGRRRSIRLLIALLLTTSIITQGLLQFIPMSIKQKFGILLINQFVSGIDTFTVSFVLFMELTTSTYATLVGNIALVGFAFGEIVVAGMAYLCRHWLLLKWAMTLYVLALVPYLFFVPESPHWLLAKYRYDELEKVLRQIARFNQRPDSRWFPFYRYMIENHRKQKDLNQKNKIKLSFFAKLYRFLTHIPTMSKLFVSGLLGFVTLLLYFKISYSLGAMNEIDPYLNIIIGAVVEAIGYIIPSLFMIRCGRKPVMILFLILVAICLLITPLTFNQNCWIIILLAQFGKFAISGAVGVTYILVPELFPTSIRATGMGFFILFSRLGSTIAPIIDSMISHSRTLTTYMYYIYTGLTILCVLLTLLLPETRNVPLVDKIDYNMKKNPKTSSNIQSITRS